MHYPIIPSTDNRRTKGCIPTVLRNCYIEPQAGGANKRSPYVVRPTPGRRALVALPEILRGVFCQPGCQAGAPFAISRSYLYSISPVWAATNVGATPGGDVATLLPLQDKLVLRSEGDLFEYDSGLTQVTDVDAPNPAMTLAVAGARAAAAFSGGALWGWCRAGDFLDWDPSGQASDVDLPDPVVGQVGYGDDIWSLNAISTQIWRADPTAPTEDLAFSPLTGVNIPIGLAARGAVSKCKDGLRFIGHDRAAYKGAGLAVSPIPNRDLEEALQTLSEGAMAAAITWTHALGSKEFWVVRTSLERAFVLDLSNGLWHERTKFGASQYDLCFSAQVGNTTIVGADNSGTIWALDPDVYTDAGEIIERVMSVSIPVAGGTSIDRIVLDARWFGQPTSGQGSAPQLILDYSTNGGQDWGSDYGNQRVVDVPGLGDTWRVQEFGFGQCDAQDGFLLTITITDPIGFALAGIWINPSDEELSGRG